MYLRILNPKSNKPRLSYIEFVSGRKLPWQLTRIQLSIHLFVSDSLFNSSIWAFMYDHYDNSSEDDEWSESTKHSSKGRARATNQLRTSSKEEDSCRSEKKTRNYGEEEKKEIMGEIVGGQIREDQKEGQQQKEAEDNGTTAAKTATTGRKMAQKRTTTSSRSGDKSEQKQQQKGAWEEEEEDGTTEEDAIPDEHTYSDKQVGQQRRKVEDDQQKRQLPKNSKAAVTAQSTQNGHCAEEEDVTGWTMPTLRQDSFDHFSFTCHLFPRLSESNLQFHDIYWDRDPNTKFVTLRKRQVFVVKLVRSLLVRHIGSDVGKEANAQRTEYRADFSLIDRRPFARREVVSNIFTIQVPILGVGGPRRLFRKAPSSASVLVRSNYRQRAVALQILLQRSTTFADDSHSVQFVGRAELELLDENAKMALPNRTHSFTFHNIIRFEFETADIPSREQIQADSLPDVLICDQAWLPMLAIYRQLVCETLSEGGDVFADRSVWVVDPVMATFPALLDTDRDAGDLLIGLMHKFSVYNRELTPQAAAQRFRFVYMHFILPLTALIDDSKWREKLRTFVKGQLDVEEPNPIKMFATEPCRAMDTFEYALNLCGEHSID